MEWFVYGLGAKTLQYGMRKYDDVFFLTIRTVNSKERLQLEPSTNTAVHIAGCFLDGFNRRRADENASFGSA